MLTTDSSGRTSGNEGDVGLDLADYLIAVVGPAPGWVHVATGWEPRRAASGKIRFGHWQPGCVVWPDEADGLAALLLEWSTKVDIYLCPYPLSGQERAKDTAVVLDKVHCDGDDGVDLAKAEAIRGACAVGSGTPRHAHVYVLLTHSVPPHHHEEFCKRLAVYLGAKDPKFSDNDLLRPPGTWNFKPRADDPKAEPLPVRWLIRPSGVRIDPEELAGLLGVELTDVPVVRVPKAGPRAKSRNGSGVVALGEVSPLDISRYPLVRRALEKNTGDRSEDIMRVVGACVRSGLTGAQARWVVRQRNDLTAKLAEVNHDDIARCYAKALEDR
jgi:putative DNA primase/helicase